MADSQRAGRAAVVTLASVLFSGSAAAQEIECNEEMAAAASRLRSKYQAQFAKCLKEGKAATCDLKTQFVLDGEDELRRRIADEDGSCAQALSGGVPLSDLGPAVCPPSGARCDERVWPIVDLDGLADCLVCQQEGLEVAYRLQADLPDEVANNNERKCIRSVVSRSLKAIRAGIRDVDTCGEGGQSPFACPADDDPATKFGAALSKIAVATQKCRNAAGEVGAVSGDSALLCHHTAGAPADLARCGEAITRCLVCSHANLVYRQSQDCTQFAGIPCRGTSATEGRVFVANENSDSLTYFEQDDSDDTPVPLFGTIPASSFNVGDAPGAVATNLELNIVYAASAADGSVTMLDAATGAPLFGTLANSTFDAGVEPAALAVDMDQDILYVADRASDAVLLLNALDGRPYYGTLPASTVAVGDDPRALMHSQQNGIVYVANYGSDSLTLLDSATGAYRNSTLVASTVATGDGPIALSDPDADYYFYDDIFVANHLDDTVTQLDGDTGAPVNGTVEASSKDVGAGPRSVTVGPRYFTQERLLYVASDDGTMTILKNETGEYLQRTRSNATFPLDSLPAAGVYNASADSLYVSHPGTDTIATFGKPDDLFASYFSTGTYCSVSDFEVDAGNNRLYVGCRNRVEVLDATTGAFAFGTQENSTFPLGSYADHISLALDADAGVLYVLRANYESAQILFMDAVTGAVLPQAPVVTDRTWEIAHNPALELLYAVDLDGWFRVIDAATGDVLSTEYTGLEGPLLLDASAGTLYAAGGYDNWFVRYLDAADGSPLFGTTVNSTFATERYASALAINSASNLLYVANYYDYSVTFLDATTGAYPSGTLAGSTFPAGPETYGDYAVSVAVDAATSQLFVNASRRITILDSETGLPKYGALAESKVDAFSDNRPTLAVNPAANRLYFGYNYGGVVYYDLTTGAFINSSLPRTPTPAGDAPSAMALME